MNKQDKAKLNEFLSWLDAEADNYIKQAANWDRLKKATSANWKYGQSAQCKLVAFRLRNLLKEMEK